MELSTTEDSADTEGQSCTGVVSIVYMYSSASSVSSVVHRQP